jgi:hypothetical protein
MARLTPGKFAMNLTRFFLHYRHFGHSRNRPVETMVRDLCQKHRYGTIPDFRVAELVAGADPARKLDIAMMVWLVRGNGHDILVGSAFYHDRFFKDCMLRISPSLLTR